MTTECVLLGLLFGGIALGCFVELSPFFSALLLAAALVFTTGPRAEWVRLPRDRGAHGHAHGRDRHAAAATSARLPWLLARVGFLGAAEAFRAVALGLLGSFLGPALFGSSYILVEFACPDTQSKVVMPGRLTPVAAEAPH